jgi:hypothetical protein
MQGADPCKMWFLDVFEVGLMVVRSSGYNDYAAADSVFISVVNVCFW